MPSTTLGSSLYRLVTTIIYLTTITTTTTMGRVRSDLEKNQVPYHTVPYHTISTTAIPCLIMTKLPIR